MKFAQRLIYFCIGCILVGLLSCSEDAPEDNQDDNTNGKYSGITQTDEEGHFISIDADDWQDDGLLTNCYAYPNPAGYYTTIVHEANARYKLMIIRNSKGELVRPKCDASSVAAASGGTVEGNVVIVNDKCRFVCESHWPMGLLDFRTVEKINPSCDDFLYKQLPQGIYRVFLYATDSQVVYKQLMDLGVTPAPKEKYSMVYGDIQFAPGPPAKIERTDPPDGGEMPQTTGKLKIFFDAPIISATVNGDGWGIKYHNKKYLEWHVFHALLDLPQGAQKLNIKWLNYDGSESSHSISVTVK